VMWSCGCDGGDSGYGWVPVFVAYRNTHPMFDVCMSCTRILAVSSPNANPRYDGSFFPLALCSVANLQQQQHCSNNSVLLCAEDACQSLAFPIRHSDNVTFVQCSINTFQFCRCSGVGTVSYRDTQSFRHIILLPLRAVWLPAGCSFDTFFPQSIMFCWFLVLALSM
jgi:hypothetical protein